MSLLPLFLLFLYVLPAYCWISLQPSNSPPSARQGHSAVSYDDSIMIVFGGRTTVVMNVNSTIVQSSLCSSMGGCNEALNAGSCDNECANATLSLQCSCICNDDFSGVNCQIQDVDTWLSDVAIYDITSNTWTIWDADPIGTVNAVSWSRQHIADGANINNVFWHNQSASYLSVIV